MARRLEATYSKKAILAVYLNQIYLGDGAWGVRGGGAALLPEGPRSAHARRVRADRGAREGADRVLADPRQEARDRAPQPRARSRWRSTAFANAGRRRRREEGDDHARPLSRHLPRSHAVLRRARAPLHHRSLRQRRAVRQGPADRDRGRADAGRPPRTRTPISARAIRTSARAGADRSGGSMARRARSSSSARSSSTARRRSCPSKRYLAVVDKVDERARRGHRSAIAGLQLPLREHELGGEVADRQRRERSRRSRARPRRSSPATSCGCRARSARVPKYRDWDLGPDGKNPTWIVARRPARVGRRARRRRAARAGAASADHDLHRRSSHRLRRRDGRRLRLRPLGVQPRRAGVPPAGLDVQADLLLARARSGLRLRHRARRHAGRDHRSGHRRGVDADEPRRHDATHATSRSSTRSCSRRTCRRSICSSGSARRTSSAWARRPRLHDEDLRRRCARTRRVVQQARRDGARVHRVRAPRPVVAARAGSREGLGLRAPDRRSHRRDRSRTTRCPRIPSSRRADRIDRVAAIDRRRRRRRRSRSAPRTSCSACSSTRSSSGSRTSCARPA